MNYGEKRFVRLSMGKNFSIRLYLLIIRQAKISLLVFKQVDLPEVY